MTVEGSPLPAEGDPASVVPGVTAADLEVALRSELAATAINTAGEIMGLSVDAAQLLQQSRDPLASAQRLLARRTLRCAESLGREASSVVAALGNTPAAVYPYVEAVLVFGASELNFMKLMEKWSLSPEEVTALYALGREIADVTGQPVSFPAIRQAVTALGLSLQDAIADPERTLCTLVDAGYILDHAGRKVFDAPILSPQIAQAAVPLGKDIDTVRTSEAAQWVRRAVEGLRQEPVDPEEAGE